MKSLSECLFYAALFVTFSVPAISNSSNPTDSRTVMQVFPEISIFDGNNNSYKLFRSNSDEKITIRYEPVKPSQSSSGVYNGGSVKESHLGEEQFKKILKIILELIENKDCHSERRKMGTFLLKYQSSEMKAKAIIIKNPQLQALMAELQQILISTSNYSK